MNVGENFIVSAPTEDEAFRLALDRVFDGLGGVQKSLGTQVRYLPLLSGLYAEVWFTMPLNWRWASLVSTETTDGCAVAVDFGPDGDTMH